MVWRWRRSRTDDSVSDSHTADVQASRHGPARLLTPLASLSNRNFRLLWLGQVGQASSMWAEQVARNWLIWELTESGLALGLVNLFRAVPLLVLGLWAGVAADRFNKRKLLILMQVWSFLVYVAMAVLIVGGWIEVWHIYVTVALLGAGMAMNQPVRTSWVPQMVGQAQLLNALSLNSIAINTTRLIGPALIGILIAVADVGIAYIISAVLYTLVILSTFLIDAPPAQVSKDRGSMTEQLMEGLRFMAQDRLVLLLVVIGLGPLAFAFSYMTLLPILATDVLGMGSGGFRALMSAGAVGGLIGGLTLASRSDIAHKGRLMLVAGLGYGFVLILLGGARWAVAVFPIISLAGACQTVFRTSNNAALLQITPPQLQGRIISMTLLDTAMAPLASVAAGLIADVIDVSTAMAVIGGVCIVIVADIALLEPRIGRL